MISVFELMNQNETRNFDPGQLTQLRNNATLTLKKIKEHYRHAVRVVESDHILIQILQHLPTKPELNDGQYYQFCQSASRLTHRALNLNTETVLSGVANQPYFFGKGFSEFYLLEEKDLGYRFDATTYWRDLIPVRILSHPLTGLTFNVRDGRNNEYFRGEAYLSIDIGLLAVQYRHWSRFNNDTETEHRPVSINQFVYQYPLVNMIEHDIDICFFNRLRLALGYLPSNNDKPNHGLAIYDLKPLTDHIWSQWIPRIKSAERRFIDLPSQIPEIFTDNLKDNILIPNTIFNRQNLGLYTLAYLPYISTLSRLSSETGSKDNGSVKTILERWYQRFIVGNYFAPIAGINPQYTQRALLDEVLIPLRGNQ